MQIANFTAPPDKALEMVEKAYDIVSRMTADEKQVMGEVAIEQEKAAKARIDCFSAEKGKELNRQYQEYLEGCIKENFETVVHLTEQKVALMEEVARARIQISEEKAQAEIELKKIEAQIKEKQTHKVRTWVQRIAYPLLGVILGIVTHLLLEGF